MAEFDIVDLTVQPTSTKPAQKAGASGQTAGKQILGAVDSATIAASLESLRKDLTEHITNKGTGLKLTSLTVRLSISAEGKVAFVAKGAAEASIEVVFGIPAG